MVAGDLCAYGAPRKLAIIDLFNQFCTIYTFAASRGLSCTLSQFKKSLPSLIALDFARWCLLAPTMISIQPSDCNDFIISIKDPALDEAGKADVGKKRKRKQVPLSTAGLVAIIDQRRRLFTESVNAYQGDWLELDRLASLVFPINSQQPHPADFVMRFSPCDNISEATNILRDVFNDKILLCHRFQERAARYSEPPDKDLFAKELVEGARQCLGVDLRCQLYSHQIQAIKSILRPDGNIKNVVVATSTSSGKSLIFNLPIVQAIINQSHCTDPVCALYIFPTKALAQDQLGKLRSLLDCCGLAGQIRADIYDGDTPPQERKRIRESCQIIFTNPDMLHVSILPNPSGWSSFLRYLRFVVVDEIHVYSGVFGSNVAFVMRRLQRLLAGLKQHQTTKDVHWITCSATIANPAEHSTRLLNLSPDSLLVVDEDGSPRRAKEFVVCRSNGPLSDAADILLWLTECRLKTIAFCNTRKVCELLMNEVQSRLRGIVNVGSDKELADKIKSYRGGYKMELRREIEAMLFKGQLNTVVATNALELGIDVGNIDVTLHLGFPGSLASLWQQAGRAGRRQRDSMAILLLDYSDSAPSSDAYYCQNPGAVLKPKYESVPLNVGRSATLYRHLQCAGKEQPLHPDNDQPFFGGDELPAICEQQLNRINGTLQYFCRPEFLPHPPSHFPLRNSDDDDRSVKIYLGAEFLEEMGLERALYTAYQDAIYMHEGKKYLVKRVDFSSDPCIASVEPVQNVGWITEPRDSARIHPQITQLAVPIGVCEDREMPIQCNFGRLSISITLLGYKRLDPNTRRVLLLRDLPPFTVEREYEGCWIDVPLSTVRSMKENSQSDIFAALGVICKAIMKLMPIYVLCAGYSDVGVYWSRSEEDLPPRLAIYDRNSAGGFTRMAFAIINIILQEVFNAIGSKPDSTEDENCARNLLGRLLSQRKK